MSDELRRRLVETARAMNQRGLNRGTAGNVSARLGDGMLITPSGIGYERLGPGDVVGVDGNGVPAGPHRPSSEWRLHLDIYARRPEAGAILHAHPTHCSALACLRRPMPAFHYMVAVAGGRNIRCAPYATFGTRELSRLAVEALRGRMACLLANHGLVCLEQDLARVLDLAGEVEELARVYLHCLAAGKPHVLSDEEMATVVERFRDYGKYAKNDPDTG